MIKKILTDRKPGPPILPRENPFGPDPNAIPLPAWFTEEDLKFYAEKYEQKGFTGGLNYYRALDLYAQSGYKFNLFAVNYLNLIMV